MKAKQKGLSTMLVAVIVVLVVAIAAFLAIPREPAGQEQEDIQVSLAGQADLKTFASEDEVKEFLKGKQQSYGSYFGSAVARGAEAQTLEAATAADTGGAPAPAVAGQKASDYSTTNVQVAGVDEGDFVKNDGEYIYTISGENVVIVDALPAENAQIVSILNLSGKSPQQIYVNGDRLVVIGNEYNYYPYPVPLGEPIPVDIGGGIGSSDAGAAASSGADPAEAQQAVAQPDESAESKMIAPGIWPRYSEPTTYINVYDITDRSNPDLLKNLVFNGTYFNSRMIGGHVYAIVNSYPQYYGDDIILPRFYPGQVGFPEVYYFDIPFYSYQFTNVFSVNVDGDPEVVDSKVFMLGYSSNLYVSENTIYMTYQKQVPQDYMFNRVMDEVILPNLPESVAGEIREVRDSDKSDYRKRGEIEIIFQDWLQQIGPEEAGKFYTSIQEKLEEIQNDIQKELDKSVVHKISISNGNIEYRTKGEVPGQPLNQFSMDEHNGFFRIATTTNTWGSEPFNNLYVLDDGMNIVGKIEELAEGERIFSARFIGNRAYLVTFVQIDPLFVIDLSDPANPQVLGELKIPGVSDYLHPYDENHIIGVGRATEEIKDRVTFSGLKLSLFDVSDVSNPVEVDNYEIGERGTNSEALYDHKAFLFSREKNLLVIPVMRVDSLENEWWGQPSWQGAYAFSLTLENGFELKGSVTHATGEEKEQYYYYYGPYSITRSLYMDDVLYTISQKAIKASSLEDLDDISTVELPGWPDYPVYVY